MTTIAANRASMAADTLITDDSLTYHARKLFREGDAIIGMCGNVSEFQKFLRWWRGGKKDEIEINGGEGGENFSAMVLQKDGLRLYLSCAEVDPMPEDCYALGSGAVGAMVAMKKMGYQPKAAVEAVCDVTVTSGRPVDAMRLSTKRRAR